MASTSSGSDSDRAHPEAPAHVDQLRVRPFFERGLERLQRHAADRTMARTIAADLRMHRASPDRSLGNFGWHTHCQLADCSSLVRRIKVAIRVGPEFLQTAGAAEMMSHTAKFEVMRTTLRVDTHTANRIRDGAVRARNMVGIFVMVVVLSHRHSRPFATHVLRTVNLDTMSRLKSLYPNHQTLGLSDSPYWERPFSIVGMS